MPSTSNSKDAALSLPAISHQSSSIDELASRPRDLPSWLWIWLPLAAFAFPYLTRPFLSLSSYATYIYGEFGVMENLTVICLVIGTVVGVRLFQQRKVFPSRWIGWWYLLIAAGCFYMAGEELSWGQHFVGWQTPTAWSALKPEQDETNLHNLSRLFNDYPRSLLAVVIVLATVIIPLYFKSKNICLNSASAAYWLWPSSVAFLTGFFTLAVTFHKRFAKRVLHMPFTRQEAIWVEESQEVFFALFLMIYLYSTYVRSKQQGDADEGAFSEDVGLA